MQESLCYLKFLKRKLQPAESEAAMLRFQFSPTKPKIQINQFRANQTRQPILFKGRMHRVAN